uniref:Ig-like domain-containing protein n=1 Tax=Zosterops lateralis melanops TaxID=1220523 RepID=A0A8D2PX21_ZOSLA
RAGWDLFQVTLLWPRIGFSWIQAIMFCPSGGAEQTPGGSLTLLCHGSGFDFGKFGMFWVRQSPGQGLEWVEGIHDDSSARWHSPSLRGRVTVARDNGQSSVTLTIHNLTDEDSGSYFCATNFDSSSGWGSATLPSLPQLSHFSGALNIRPKVSSPKTQPVVLQIPTGFAYDHGSQISTFQPQISPARCHNCSRQEFWPKI